MATAPIDTPERTGQTISHTVAAATLIYAGVLVALNAVGDAVPASDAAALKVVGRSEQTMDNSAGAGGDQRIAVKRGVFKYANSATNALAASDKGKIAYVEDDSTVASTSTNKCKAGIVLDVESDGVWIDTTYAHLGTQIYALTSTDGTAAGAADLAALKVESEKIGDDVRAVHAALKVAGILK